MIMRYIGSFILLLCFLCLRANAQGLEFMNLKLYKRQAILFLMKIL